MSFILKSYQGHASQLTTELEVPSSPQHQREENVVSAVEESIKHIVNQLGDVYVSIDARGHVNPLSGDTGDEINIRVVTLPAPTNYVNPVGADTPVVEETVSTVGTASETPVVEPTTTPAPVDPIAPSSEPVAPVENAPVVPTDGSVAALPLTPTEPVQTAQETATPGNPSAPVEPTISALSSTESADSSSTTPAIDVTSAPAASGDVSAPTGEVPGNLEQAAQEVSSPEQSPPSVQVQN